MRFDSALLALTLLSTATATALSGDNVVRSDSTEHDLYKRRGGGGGGGRGGGGGGGSGGNRGGGSTGNSGTSSGGGGFSGSASGGRTYGGGNYYAGGAQTPYRPARGSRSPSGILPFVLVGSALAFWPGLWLGSAYMYRYDDEHRFFNETSDQNESIPVICGCAENADCTCDDAEDDDYLDEVIGNGNPNQFPAGVSVAQVNGTQTLLINGTVEEGSDSWASPVMQSAGYWPAAAAIAAAILMG